MPFAPPRISMLAAFVLAAVAALGQPDVADAQSAQTIIPPELPNVKIKLGNEVLLEDTTYSQLLRGKRLGLVTNPTGVDSKLVSTIDKLAAGKQWKLVALYGPEHGLRGAQGAGEKVESKTDPVTGIPAFSLYGKTSKPTPEMLKGVDVLLYDIQDIGNRSYTYISTMERCMQAAKENNIEFVVLDRPDPMGGDLVDGNVLDPAYRSMVGTSAIAYLYGMTPGEMALYMNEKDDIHCKLTVVPMKGWTRSMKWGDTGLPWIPTSTHMQHVTTCWHIAVTGTFGELHTLNEGVGYPAPFEYVGAPWIDSVKLANELNRRHLPGIYFRPAYYRPYYQTFEKQQCGGVQVLITDYDKVRPVEAGMHVLEAVNKLYPEKNVLLTSGDLSTTETSRAQMFDKVMGTDKVRKALGAGQSAESVTASWKPEREKFVAERQKYLLYK